MNRAEIDDFVKDVDSALHTGPVFGASEEFLAELLLDAQALAQQLKEAMTALEQIAKAKERWDAALEHVLQHIEHDDGAEWSSASHHEGVMAEAYHKASDGARAILSRWEAP